MVFAGFSSFIHNLQLASHDSLNMAEKSDEKGNSKFRKRSGHTPYDWVCVSNIRYRTLNAFYHWAMLFIHKIWDWVCFSSQRQRIWSSLRYFSNISILFGMFLSLIFQFWYVFSGTIYSYNRPLCFFHQRGIVFGFLFITEEYNLAWFLSMKYRTGLRFITEVLGFGIFPIN